MSDLSFQHSLFARLRALEESAFPKTCANCGRKYRTHEEFLTATHPVRRDHTGLKQSYDDDGAVIVDVFRNCVCGSTLLESFHDRRDTSPAGQKRRARFAEMLSSLVAAGLSESVVRGELLLLMRGKPNRLVELIRSVKDGAGGGDGLPLP